ncbi:hypothetical protein, variant 3 [Aphanomyces astaci]|uniref:Uncharacterized protein n=1 Tax=Aphanomyces astaci TaxID=112090 RepID=W4FIU3_APHAT|nr:hypothetical protein, variant 3 [Aphanomyces astaci]ETV66759.1 hypothetical protein, variant 3 [Aphanomyces astaci]|eukprot:XP_009843733.1 hypothetical protein, variant 3 [Aphanomyces astaci]
MAACRASTLMFSYASVKRSLNGMELVPRKYNSVSTINRVKSAVVFLHREAKVAVSTELNAMMKEYVSDYRRKFAQLKESGEAPITEEKSPLPFGGYSYLASVAVATEYDYSCLGVLLLTRGAQVPESPTLLFGYNAKERFSAWLAKTCAANADDIAGLGLSISDIVMVWLRACWSLGGVQGRYIFEGSGGDQFEGRAATGLNVNDVEFGALPPHFGQSVSLSPAQKELILPVYSSFYPATFRSTVPYLLASLVHHHAWLKSTLHHSHPLFLYHVWLSGSLPALLAGLHGGTLYNPIANMMATEMSYHTVYDTISNQ